MRKTILLLLLLSIISIQKIWAQTRQADSLALVSLYNATNGSNWTITWNLAQPIDTWNGVRMLNNRVQRLSFYGNNIMGTLPDLNLTALESLAMFNERLIGNLPNFTNLPSLETLKLNGGQLSGSIPDFTNLPQLRELSLRDNRLSGSIPNFTNLSNLETLELGSNGLSGSIPNFTNLPVLARLSLGGNLLSGNIPNFINVSQLTYLWLVGNQLSGSIPNFPNLPQIRTLWLSNNLLSGSIPNFSNMPLLEDLSFSNNLLSGNIPDFTNLPMLDALSLFENQLSGAIPNFTNLPLLERLSIHTNQLSGSIPNFTNLPVLTNLTASINQLSGTLPDFTNLIFLEQLSLHTNQLNGAIPDFTNLPFLESLSLQNNQLSGSIPTFGNVPYLEYLQVQSNELSGLIPSFTNLLFLRYLDINENQFTFEDFMLGYNNLTQQIINPSKFIYAPQDSIGNRQVVDLTAGASYTIDLLIDNTITTSTYYWYKDGILIDSTLGINEYTITNFQPVDSGVYTARVINTIVTNFNSSTQELILQSYPTTLNWVCVNTVGIDTQTACNSYTWIDGNIYTADNDSATYTIVGGAANGCDSIVTLDLTIKTVDITVNVADPTITANAIGATYQWLDCDSNYVLIPGETAASFMAMSNGSYAVEVSQNGCVDTSICSPISTIVGVKKVLDLENVVVFPNPTTGQVTIDFDILVDASIRVLALTGQIVYEKEIKDTSVGQLDLSQQPSGVYFMEISTSEEYLQYKLIKK